MGTRQILLMLRLRHRNDIKCLLFFCSYEDISMDSNQNQNSNPLDFSQSGIAYKDVNIVQAVLLPNQVRIQLILFHRKWFLKMDVHAYTFRTKTTMDNAHKHHRVFMHLPTIHHPVCTASTPICPITIQSQSTFPIVQ